jgi:hypothetical protein
VRRRPRREPALAARLGAEALPDDPIAAAELVSAPRLA